MSEQTKAPPQTSTESSSQTPSSPVASPTPPKKGMSTGAKIGLGLCGGCLLLIIIFSILLAVAPFIFSKILPKTLTPNFLENLIEKGIEKDTGEDVDLDISDNKWSYQDESGENSFEFGEDVELPSDFPSDIPQYSGAKLTSKITTSDGNTVTFTTSDSATKVIDYYQTQMKKNNWTETSTYEGGDTAFLSYEKNGKGASVSVYGGDEETTLSIVYGYSASE